MSRSFLYYLGNSIILLSIIGFLFIFYPILKLYLYPAPINYNEINPKGFTVVIPKINAQANVVENVNPMNQTEYLAALQHGIAQARGTSLPGEIGTIFLFAHSSDVPWHMTRYNTPFLRLGELSKNDTIIVYYKEKKYQYKVVDKKIVWPTDTSYLKKNPKTQLILQTCYPIGTAFQRLLVFAVPAQ